MTIDQLNARLITGFFLNEEFSRHNDKKKFDEYAYAMATMNLSLLYASHLSCVLSITASYIYKSIYGFKPHFYLFILYVVSLTIIVYAILKKIREKFPLEMFIEDIDSFTEEQKKPLRRFSTAVFVVNLLIFMFVETPFIFFF
jgi:hypothetical protein